MSQFDPVIGADKSGLAYRQDDNNGKKALLTHHKGPAAPGYAEAGTIWLDDSESPWKLKIFDGSQWIVQGAVSAAEDTYIPYFNGTALAGASEVSAGLVERATDAEAAAGLDASRYVTPRHLADIRADSRQLAKAWVNFNGAGDVAIRDSYNVAAITDIGTGKFRITFDVPMANADYSVNVSAPSYSSNNLSRTAQVRNDSATIGNAAIHENYVDVAYGFATDYIDPAYMFVQVFGERSDD